MATTTQKTQKWAQIKNIKKTIIEVANTTFTVGKVLGIGGGGAYLLTNGIQQHNLVFLAIGALLAAYATVVLVSTTHIATKAARV